MDWNEFLIRCWIEWYRESWLEILDILQTNRIMYLTPRERK